MYTRAQFSPSQGVQNGVRIRSRIVWSKKPLILEVGGPKNGPRVPKGSQKGLHLGSISALFLTFFDNIHAWAPKAAQDTLQTFKITQKVLKNEPKILSRPSKSTKKCSKTTRAKRHCATTCDTQLGETPLGRPTRMVEST